MDIPPTAENDVLAQSIRARLFQALAELRRPATTQELAALVGRHPNTVRVQLHRLSDAGLLERRRAPPGPRAPPPGVGHRRERTPRRAAPAGA